MSEPLTDIAVNTRRIAEQARKTDNNEALALSETVACEVAAICEVAHEIRSDVESGSLKILLGRSRHIGGRCAGSQLARSAQGAAQAGDLHLKSGAEGLAKRVWDDMRGEDVARMRSIRDERLAIESKDFWEVSDRGGNFDYLEPSWKEQLEIFFSWFREVSGAMKTIDFEGAPTKGRSP